MPFMCICFIAVKTDSPIMLLCRSESGQYDYKGVFNALRAIKNAEGLRGLTSGLVPTLMRDVPFSGIYLMFYEKLKV